MKKDNATILITTIVISAMTIFFTIMIIFIQNHYDHTAEETSGNKEKFSAASGDGQNVVEYVETPAETEAASEKYDTEIIYTSDKIDLSLDDTAMHDIEYEKSYEDTVELLPSVYYEHQPIPRESVSEENFPKSFEGDERTAITFGTDLENETAEIISVPSEVTLYNVDYAESNSYKITAEIIGDRSYIKSLGWSTPDSSKLRLSKTSGETTTVSRESDFTGTMLVSLVVTYDTGMGMTATEHLDIYVHVKNMTDTNTRLLDRDGNELYVDESATTAAYLQDYAKYDTFYGPMKVTGWQEIAGKTYYFNEGSWAVTGEQVIGGTKYTFDDEGALIAGEEVKGIDVSLYQKEIDWEQVAASGIDFAIIRCGFRGAVTGRLVEDACFRRNIEGAKVAGLRVGVYFFTQALNEQEAVEEANMVLSLCSDYSLELPIFIDSENARNGRANDLDKTTRTNVTKTFCETISAGGYEAGVYASKSWYYHKLDVGELEQYCIWVAQYNTECNYTGKANYWQYTSKGHVSGIEGNVDLDIVMR